MQLNNTLPKSSRTNQNPTFTHEIQTLTKQRDKLKPSATPYSRETTEQITSLNTIINQKVNGQKTNKHSPKKRTQPNYTKKPKVSHNRPVTLHEAITTNKKLPSNKQANTTINHHARISHLLPNPEDSRTIRRKHKFTADQNHTPFTAQARRTIRTSKHHQPAIQVTSAICIINILDRMLYNQSRKFPITATPPTRFHT